MVVARQHVAHVEAEGFGGIPHHLTLQHITPCLWEQIGSVSSSKGELGAVVVHVFHVFYLFLPHYMGMQFVQKNNKERTHMILQVVIVWQAIFQEIDHMVFKM